MVPRAKRKQAGTDRAKLRNLGEIYQLGGTFQGGLETWNFGTLSTVGTGPTGCLPSPGAGTGRFRNYLSYRWMKILTQK